MKNLQNNTKDLNTDQQFTSVMYDEYLNKSFEMQRLEIDLKWQKQEAAMWKKLYKDLFQKTYGMELYL